MAVVQPGILMNDNLDNMTDHHAHADQKYIDALLHNDSRLLAEVYERFAGKVIAFIKKNHGDESDAQDIIQETLIVMYRQAFEKKLKLTCPFEAYFFLLCKRRWLNKLKDSFNKRVTIEDDFTSIDDRSEQMAAESERYEMKNQLLEEKLLELGEKCQEIIHLSLKIKSMEALAEKLNVSYAYIRKKKSLCMKQLTELVRQSKMYQKLKDI